MADNLRRAGSSQRPDTSTGSPRRRPDDESSGGTLLSASENVRGLAENSTHSGGQTLHPQQSRASLNEQFATSRREFEFDEDEEPLEPAPIIESEWGGTNDDFGDEDGEESAGVDDETIRRLLKANEGVYDYYTLLGLAREPPPTVSQIRAAYHRLSLAFHPDKHPHSLKAAAQKYFTRLQKAYETLIEPRKRVIYDLEGEEGVQNEYRAGGAMGKGGEGERQIGVKTMGAEEFKKWFMGVLLERERRGIDELVGSSGTCKLVLNARNGLSLFSGYPRVLRYTAIPNQGDRVEELGDFELPAPPITAHSIQLRQSFSIPLPGLGELLRSRMPSWQEILRGGRVSETEEDERPARLTWENSVGPYIPKLTFTGAVGGKLEESMAVRVPDEGAPNEMTPAPYFWYTLHSDKVQFSARLDHTFPETRERKNSHSIASAMQGVDLDVTAGLFPKRNLNIGIGRPFILIEDTRPYHVHLRTFFNHQLNLKPPVLDFRVSRSLGDGHTGYCRWSSGDFAWPAIITSNHFLPVTKAPLFLPYGRLIPNMRIGYFWTESGARLISTDEDDDMHLQDPDEITDEKPSNVEAASTNHSWHLVADASPYNAKLTLTWGRDLFVRTSEYPIQSRIMKNGEAVKKSTHLDIPTSRGVRLEIEGEVGLNVAFGGVVRGVRRIGDFTTIGIGIGLNPQRGLYMSFSWSRLGQNIILPVILLSEEEVDLKSIFWALALPWATYAAIEFIALRPRLRRKRIRQIERRRKELRENVVKRKAEAEQAIVLMRPLVEHRQAMEREQGSLVILKAEYGVREIGPDSKASWRLGEVADVTVALAALVDGGQLSLPKGLHKSQIIGFWDPAPLKKKHLTVDYLFGGKQHHVEVVGYGALSIPMRSHEI